MKNKKDDILWIYQRTKGTRSQLIIYMLVALCMPIVQLVFAYFLKLFIDIATGITNMSLLHVGLRTIEIVAVGGIVIIIKAVLSQWIYGKVECNMRVELMDIIFSRCMIDLSKQHTGELFMKLTADVQAVSACFTTFLDDIVGGVVSILLTTTVLFFLNWKIGVLLLFLMPFFMFFMKILTPQVQKASANDKSNEEANRSMIQESLTRIMLIKTYFMQEKSTTRVKCMYEMKLKSGIHLGMWEGMISFAGILFGYVMCLITLGVGAYFVIKGETTVGSLIMIVQLLNYIVNPIAKFSEAIAKMSQALVSSERIKMIYELPADCKRKTIMPIDATELVVKDLYFSYSDQENLLKEINMAFLKGEITGIVGESGSGKSTLLKLMIGLFQPKKGAVILRHADGILCGEEIMGQVAYVPPENYLFSGSIAENIIMSEREGRYDELLEAAADANILAFIKALPNEFYTIIGEGGGTVSSGQAQRIAIARAIYKKAEIIVFDEPTANLDRDSIKKFQLAIRNFAKDKICIIVTHDISMLKVCDKVYILEKGYVRKSA